MKLINNLSIRLKMILIALPTAIALLVSVIYTAVEINNTQQILTNIYFDTLYTVNSNLVNVH